MSVVFMYDSTNQYAIPSSAVIVGAYSDGLYANVAAAKAAHPNAFVVTITVTGTHNGSIVADCESGDLTPDGAANWAAVERSDGRYPTIYTSISNIGAVSAALSGHGLHFSTDPADTQGVYLWAAGYTDHPYLYAGAVATQYSGGITAPYDISETNGVWPYHLINTDPPPPPVAPSFPGSLTHCVGGGLAPDGKGYWLVTASGGVFTHGKIPFEGSTGGVKLAAPIVGVASHPTQYGYWLVAADGGVFAFGAAKYHGNLSGHHLNAPIVAIASTKSGNGYFMAAKDGGVFTFGDAVMHGSAGNVHLAKPIVDIAVDTLTGGYALIASDGGVFAFDSPFYGSLGAVKLNAAIVSGAPASNGGYRMVGSDGGVFCFKSAFYGSTGNVKLNQPIVDILPTHTGKGYYLIATDGGVFTFGDAVFYGAGQ